MSPLTSHEPSPELLPGLTTRPRVPYRILPDVPVFRCPHCQALTTFVAYYPLEPDPVLAERAALDKASRALLDRGFHHRDFVCQGCGRGVRVVYGAIEFAMSSYLFVPERLWIGGPPR